MAGQEGWNSAPAPHADPVGVSESEIDQEHVVRPQKPVPVWVLLRFEDETLGPHRTEGFAKAWAREHVLVQIRWVKEYYLGARDLWVEASDVRRRTIQPQWLGRE